MGVCSCGDLGARCCQRVAVAAVGRDCGVLEIGRHADDVLGRHVVPVLRICRDHANQLFGGRGDDVDGYAVRRERVEELRLRSENYRRVHFVLDQLFAVPVRCWDGAVLPTEGHQFVDPAFELSQSEAGPNLGDPWVAEEGVQGAEARVVAVEGFGVVGGVFEGDEVEFRVGGEVGAGEDLAVFEEGQEGFFEVVLVGGVLRWESVFSGCD